VNDGRGETGTVDLQSDDVNFFWPIDSSRSGGSLTYRN